MTDPELQKKLVRMVERMPAFPHSVGKVLEMTSKIDCAPKDLVHVIDHDPVMTMKILKLVNSAYFGLSRKVTSINQGVVFVGINTIKNLALTIATMGVLPKDNQAGMNMTKFLLHSLGTSTIAKMLGVRLGASAKESADYFVAGLLHDFGKVVFAQYMPTEFGRALKLAEEEKITLQAAETRVIGADHTEIGGMLGERWQLPEALSHAMRAHHDDRDLGSPQYNQIRDCVLMANLIVKMQQFGNAGSPVVEDPPASVLARFQVESVQALADSLENLTQEMEKTRVFIRL